MMMAQTSTAQDLVEKLKNANRSYYDTGESEMTDGEYDALRDHLASQGIELSTLTPPEPTTNWLVLEHAEPMSGIPLCARDHDEWLWIQANGGFEFGTVSIKYDGLSVEMVYKNGKLDACILRGDGLVGEDVYSNARHVKGVPPVLDEAWLKRWIADDYTGTFSVFGELVISWNNLDLVNQLRATERKNPYKSPRSAVSMVRGRGNRMMMQYMVFRPFSVSPSGSSNLRASLVALKRASDKFMPVDVDDHVSPEDAWRRLKLIESSRDRYQFQMDGVVYVDDGGDVAKLKFSPESRVTTVTNIVEQLGRTGIVTPVIEFAPVELAGATVTRATGHNVVLMNQRLEGLGVGAKVVVTRRGEVIPHVERIVEASSDPWIPGVECPSCGSTVVVDGSVRRCSADPGDCDGTAAGLIVKYCKSLSIEGVGPSMATLMVGTGLINVPSDLYMINAEMLAACNNGIGNVGEAIATKICDNIQAKREMSWGELLGAIGIPGCANSVMNDVALVFNEETLRECDAQALAEIDGVGKVRADKISTYVATRWDDVIGPLLQMVSLKTVGSQLDGKSFCITLSLRSCGRSEMETRIRGAGGIVKSSVSSKLSYLVCNTPDAATSKLKRAQALGVPVISEQELVEMMGGEDSEIVEAEITDEDMF
jgi:DNA ligase (NAD+)